MEIRKALLIISVLTAVVACTDPMSNKKEPAAGPPPGSKRPIPSPTPAPTPPQAYSMDFIQAETITTSSGFDFRGALQETSEKQTTPSGYSFEGTFYEF